VSVLLGNGDGTFQSPVRYDVGAAVSSVAVADLNGDGTLDVVAGTGAGVSVLLGNGDGSFQRAITYTAARSSSGLALGDVNGDGILDVITVNAGTPPFFNGTVSVLLGDGDGSFRAGPSYAVGGDPRAVALGTSMATVPRTSSSPTAASTGGRPR
jgi:hypothetical protein